jgi:hypothetical protein
MRVREDACSRLGLDPKAVARAARRLQRAALDLNSMGLYLFANAGRGYIVFPTDLGWDGLMEVAFVEGMFDGGDNDLDGDLDL